MKIKKIFASTMTLSLLCTSVPATQGILDCFTAVTANAATTNGGTLKYALGRNKR